jgi:hypothetical protein
MSREMVEVTVYIVRDRKQDKAILVEHSGLEIWLPKSQIEYDFSEGETGELLLPEWLAIEKDLI